MAQTPWATSRSILPRDHRRRADGAANLAAIVALAREAASSGVALTLFAETALSAFIAIADPAHELPLGEAAPGPATAALPKEVRTCRLWIGLGLYEREGDRL